MFPASFRPSAPRTLVAIVLALIAALSGATALLASFHRDVRAARTQRHLERGHALASSRQLASAVDEYRAALSLERDHFGAARALAFALLSLGRLSEAESYLRDLLRDRPADGALNRGLARIHAARGRDADARAAFQRAIYGEWPADTTADRIETRFELVEYLSGVGAREDVLAELLRLKAELPPGQTAAARRVADLLVRAGAEDRAIELLQAAAIAAPRDVELLMHTADVQAAGGRTADARATLRRALALEPGRGDLSERLVVVDRVLALDPTLPRLRLVARTRRARLVLAAVVEQVRTCRPDGDPPAPTLDEAAARLRRPARADAATAEEELALARRLWSAFPACHGASPGARALAQVLMRVAAAEPPP